jgi:hypothetical protein
LQGRRAVREQQIWFGANVVLIENGFIYIPETALPAWGEAARGDRPERHA